VHLRLVAPQATRITRMTKLFHLTEREARELVAKQDRDRARLVRDHFSRDIHDPLLYDMTWNTETVPFEAIAAAVIAFVKTRGAEASRPPLPVVTSRTPFPL